MLTVAPTQLKRRGLGIAAVHKTILAAIRCSFEPVDCALGDRKIHFPGTKRIGVSPTLWRRDGCERCGRSCRGFDLAYLPGEEVLEPLRNRLTPVDLWVNGRKHAALVYSQTHSRADGGCDFLKGTIGLAGSCACQLHSRKPLHCDLPHVRVFHNSATQETFLQTTQYGRNWALRCPVTFSDTHRLPRAVPKKIRRLQAVARSLGLNTPLKSVLETLASLEETPPQSIIWHR